MRSDAVRLAIAQRITGVNLASDGRASSRDKLRHVEAFKDARAGERSFTVRLTAQPSMPELLGFDARVAEFEVVVRYHGAKGIEDRIGTDAERIVVRLLTMHAVNSDIMYCLPTSTGIIDADGHIDSTFSVVIGYRCDAAVAANT